MGLDYNSTVMLTCKLLFAAAKAIVDVGPDMPRQSLADHIENNNSLGDLKCNYCTCTRLEVGG